LGWTAFALTAALGVALVTTRTALKDDTQIMRGRALYAHHCASCHGAQMEGQPNWQTTKLDGRLPAPPHDKTGHTWHHSDSELFQLTKQGMSVVVPGYVSDMPAFAGILTDDDILAVLAFIKSMWPPEERNYQEMRNQIHN
jgi:mono/diheme cytochrome c family protein